MGIMAVVIKKKVLFDDITAVLSPFEVARFFTL